MLPPTQSTCRQESPPKCSVAHMFRRLEETRWVLPSLTRNKQAGCLISVHRRRTGQLDSIHDFMCTPTIYAPRLSIYIQHVDLGIAGCANTRTYSSHPSVGPLFSYPHLAVLVTESLLCGCTRTPAFTKRKVASSSPYDHQLVIYHPLRPRVRHQKSCEYTPR